MQALTLITPSSVTAGGSATGSIGANGKITFTGVNTSNTLSINGCFSATYDHYMISYNYDPAGGADVAFRMRAAGSDASGSNYYNQYWQATSTTMDASRGAATTDGRMGHGGSSVTRYSGDTVYMSNPFKALNTTLRVVNINTSSEARIVDWVSQHTLTTSYDGFTFWLASAGETIDGVMCIYGFTF